MCVSIQKQAVSTTSANSWHKFMALLYPSQFFYNYVKEQCFSLILVPKTLVLSKDHSLRTARLYNIIVYKINVLCYTFY